MRMEEMRIETHEHYRVTVLEDRIKELEEDTKVLKEQIDIFGRTLFDIVHDEDFKNLRKRVNHLEYDMKQHKHDKDGHSCMYNKSEKDDAKEFFKKLEIITKVLGRKLKLEEALLLTIFESLEIDGDEKKEEKKMNNNESITGYKDLDDALNSIPSDELDRMLKAESELRRRKDELNKMAEGKSEKNGSNHEFTDAIAQAALDMFGIDLKKGEGNE